MTDHASDPTPHTPPDAEIDVDQASPGQRPSRSAPPSEIDVSIARLATGQEGVVSLEEAQELGMSRGAREHRLASGRLFGAHRGVYLVGHEATSFRGRGFAALRACGPDAALSQLAAAAALGAAGPPATLDVTVPPGRRRSRPGIRVHHVALTGDEIAVRDGLRVTSPVRTLLDLAAVVHPRMLERVCADLMVAKLLTAAELADAVLANSGRRGIVALREIALTAEPTRSGVERAFLKAVREGGLPRPIVNSPYVVEGLGRIEPDFLWAKPRVIVETDAYGTHGGQSPFERDRVRDAALTALGWAVLRFTRRRILRHPFAVVTQVAQVLALRGTSVSP